MKITGTLSRYIARTYFQHLVFLLLILLGIIYLFDTVELIRRASKRGDIPLSLVLQMGLLKLPEVAQILSPFAILFSGIYTFWHLTRRHELVVVRAAGFSVWQFLTPVIAVAAIFGLLQMMVINPVGAVLVGKFEQLEREHLSREKSHIALFKEGLWLLQNVEEGYVIQHAEAIKQPEWQLKTVTALFFTEENSFLKRVDAETAYLEKGRWRFENSQIYQSQGRSSDIDNFFIPTNLTIKDMEKSFSSAGTMSFWRLPGHIQTLEETGFDASPLKIHYQNLLSQPLMFAAMILLAAAVSLRPPRTRSTFLVIVLGVMAGFLIFFISNFLQTLGASQQIPVMLAAWAPALTSLFISASIVIHMEDG